MARPITIDNYDVSIHERYAQDQSQLELVYFKDSTQIPHHLELAALEKSLLSKWEELFELNTRHPFANFSPPPNYGLMRNRFFSGFIAAGLEWVENEDDDEEEGEKEEEQAEIYRELIQKRECKTMPLALFERERSHLLSLIDIIQTLNGFIREIHGRKLQYQKG